MKLDWQMLKQERCPQCSDTLRTIGDGNGLLKCDSCGFMCRKSRAEEILNDIDGTASEKSTDQQADDFLKAHGITPIHI